MKTPFNTELPGDADRGRRRRWPLFAVIGLALSLLVGGTLAASITINGDDPIEFGQGSIAATSCTATLGAPGITSSYTDDDQFEVTSIVLTGVTKDCQGRWIRIGVLTDAGSNIVRDYVLFHLVWASASAATVSSIDLEAIAGDTEGAGCVDGGAAVVHCFPAAAHPDAKALNLGILATQTNRLTVETFGDEPSAAVPSPSSSTSGSASASASASF